MKNSPIIAIVKKSIQHIKYCDYPKELIANGYEVRYVGTEEDPILALQENPPLAACFQFDYPDTRGLASLRLTKQKVPAVPLLMITQSHSEQLAVWAFRTRVWDYFVEPVDTSRLLKVLEALSSLRDCKNLGSSSRERLDQSNPIPPEARLCSSRMGEQQRLLDLALAHLEANLHNRIAQTDIAKLCGLSPCQFSRLFKRLTKVTFQEYLLTLRVNEAKRLLSNPQASVTDVCFAVGFRDLSYFIRVFQRYVGLTPARYRLALVQPEETNKR